jgi:hypothetical protein
MKTARLDSYWYAAPLVALVVLAGAISGIAIGSASVVKRERVSIIEPAKDRGTGRFKRGYSEPLPNHYPLVTPNGTVPVAALATHGRLRNSRGSGWPDRTDHVPVDTGYEWAMSEAEIDRLEEWQPKPSAERRVPVETVVRVHAPDKVRMVVAGTPAAKPVEETAGRPRRPANGADAPSKAPLARKRPAVVEITTGETAAAPVSLPTD